LAAGSNFITLCPRSLRFEALLRQTVGIAALVAIIAGRADAEPQWREYAYPEQQFAVTFPGNPEVVRMPSERGVTEVVYSLEQDQEEFRVTVFDVLRAGITEPNAIYNAAASLREKGEVKLDIQAEVQGHWGHFFTLDTKDGRRLIAGVFYRNERLYEIEASAPASEYDAVSSTMVRFQQSLRFTGSFRSRRLPPRQDPGSLTDIGGRLFGGSR
jgi:hypothetical protein